MRHHFRLAIPCLLLLGATCFLPAGSAHAQSDTLAATPPMGWNSWNHFATKVTDADVRAAADCHGFEWNARCRLHLREY